MVRTRAYIAAPWSERELANEWAKRLREEIGWIVTSTWHDPDNEFENQATEGDGPEIAEKDLDEINDSHHIILKTFKRGEGTTNGRMFEAGYAAGQGIDPIAIGPIENVFVALLDREGQRFDSLDEFIATEKEGGAACG